jgi:hypothetical protein
MGTRTQREIVAIILGECLQAGDISREREHAIADGQRGERIDPLNDRVVTLNECVTIQSRAG